MVKSQPIVLESQQTNIHGGIHKKNKVLLPINLALDENIIVVIITWPAKLAFLLMLEHDVTGIHT